MFHQRNRLVSTLTSYFVFFWVSSISIQCASTGHCLKKPTSEEFLPYKSGTGGGRDISLFPAENSRNMPQALVKFHKRLLSRADISLLLGHSAAFHLHTAQHTNLACRIGHLAGSKGLGINQLREYWQEGEEEKRLQIRHTRT